jgi:serine/threonine-protein kinase HipA
LNPVPTDLKPRVLSTAITLDDGTASMELAYEVAGYFELELKEAREIAKAVGKVTGRWRIEAAKIGIEKREIDRMASAFEHPDLKVTQGRAAAMAASARPVAAYL